MNKSKGKHSFNRKMNPVMDYRHLRVISIPACIFGACAIIFNAIVIRQIVRDRKKSNAGSSRYIKPYLLSLAIADMLYGCNCLVSSSFLIGMSRRDLNQLEEEACIWMTRVFFTLASFTFLSSLFHVGMITLDRFLATTYPILHKVQMTKRKTNISISVIWVMSMLIASTRLWQEYRIAEWFTAITEILAFILIIITYVHIARVVNKNKTVTVSGEMTYGTNGSVSRAKKENKAKGRYTRNLSIAITSSFTICILTNSLSTITALCYYDEIPLGKEYSSVIVLGLNATLNPLIYTVAGIIRQRRRQNSNDVSCINSCCKRNSEDSTREELGTSEMTIVCSDTSSLAEK